MGFKGPEVQILSSRPQRKAHIAQLAERVLGKDEVSSSILLVGSIDTKAGLHDRLFCFLPSPYQASHRPPYERPATEPAHTQLSPHLFKQHNARLLSPA